jgi:nucleoside-diphosphate-sugar epimerase
MRALVTGGGGFLGTRIVEMLHERGDDVVALGRNRYPHLERAGIRTIKADLRDASAILNACEGIDTVFHAGAMAGIWGKKRTFWEINVDGTRNVLDACLARGVGKLVYTSTPSVVFGEDALSGVDESQPYPARYLAHYPETKAVAERMVLAANCPELAAVALRPHLIWGPGDPHLIPRVIARARAGKLMRVGDGRNLADITYIDNAADAHVLAAAALSHQSPCAGRAYFISQGEPVELWPWLNSILEAVGIAPVRRSISYNVAHIIGAIAEFVYGTLRIAAEPRMTRFLAAQLAKDHYFNIDAAKRDLAYVPRISTAEGLERLLCSLGTAD